MSLQQCCPFSLRIKVLRFVSQPTRLLDFSLFIIFAGIWNTHSRAGLVSFFVAMVCFFTLFLLKKRIEYLSIKVVLAVLVMMSPVLRLVV